MKNRYIFYVFFLFVSLSIFLSCSKVSQEDSLYHNDGRIKTSIALSAVRDLSDSDFPVNSSEKLTEQIRENIVSENDFYVIPFEIANHTSYSFHSPLHLKEHTKTDYLAILELIEQKEEPYTGQHVRPLYPVADKTQIRSLIQLKMRVKVYDMRGEKPELILFEILPSNHLIPTEMRSLDLKKMEKNPKLYQMSGMGTAQIRLAREVAKRICHYVNISKTKRYSV